MKTYLKIIKYLQTISLSISIVFMTTLPLMLVFNKENIADITIQNLYAIAHTSLFFVMMVRPLADIFTQIKWIRPLVILRKGVGVLSASIIVSFILAKLMVNPIEYLKDIFTLSYWSMVDYAVLGHVADISAIILIITSNNFSKNILGTWWKRVQKLSYVYFYGSAFYVFLSYGNIHQLIAIIIVTIVTIIAFIINRKKLLQTTQTTYAN